MSKLLPFLLVVLLSISPLSLEAQVASQPEPSQPLTKKEVKKFLNDYINLYMKMDFDGFMALFSKGAVENRMYPYGFIYEGYRNNFEVSKSFQYKLTIWSMKTHDQGAFVTGRYVISQTFRKWGKKKVYKGDIQFDLVRESGSLKIRELNYGMSR
jgi:hypothetical protein